MSQLQVAHSGLWLATQMGQAIQSASGTQWTFLDGATNQSIAFTANYDLRIVPTDTPQACLQPASSPPLTDGDLIVRQPILQGSDCQLWRFVAVPKFYVHRGDTVPPGMGAGWYFIIDKLRKEEGRLRIMCMDVDFEQKTAGTKIISYHVKQSGVLVPQNQWWRPQD
jgi:hypothetical protein